MPQSYVKVKGIEKKIFQEHQKLDQMNELDAKVLYTRNARSLKTYGVTFFLVKVCLIAKNFSNSFHSLIILGKNEGQK